MENLATTNTNTNTIALQTLEYNNERVLMTKQLAAYYGTDNENIKKNFQRNTNRFRDKKDYYILKGDELKEFKRKVNDIDLTKTKTNRPNIIGSVEINKGTDSPLVPRNVNTLYLWTETGALRHSKILNTNEAWEQFKVLEDCYFQVKENHVENYEHEQNKQDQLFENQSVLLNGLIDVMCELSNVLKENYNFMSSLNNRVEKLEQISLNTSNDNTNSEIASKDHFYNTFVKPILDKGGETKEIALDNGKKATIVLEKNPIDLGVSKVATLIDDDSYSKIQTCKKIYNEMDKNYDIDWAYYKRRYRKRHNIKSRKKYISKLNVIKENKKLSNIFNESVENLLVRG